MYECQLVCKEWSKAAQEALYTNVLMNLKAAAFTKTIEESTELGVFVKNIQFEDGFASLDEENISFYSSITLMHRDTLTDIQLIVDKPTNGLLVEHLKEFKFLERLQISKYELSSLDYLNKMTNDCSTVYQVRFDKLDLSTCTEPLKNIEPNESIKRIIVGDTVKFSMPSLQFFVQKFRVLEEFYMDRFVGPNENEAAENE